MTNKLIDKDYKIIIKHYRKKMPKTAKSRKQKAERLMANKLCSCIKKVTKTSKSKNKSRSIGICAYSVIKNRGMKYKGFSCKKRKIKNLNKTRKIKFKKTHGTRKRKGGRIRLKKHEEGEKKNKEARKERRRQEREELERKIEEEQLQERLRRLQEERQRRQEWLLRQQKRRQEAKQRADALQERLRKLNEDTATPIRLRVTVPEGASGGQLIIVPYNNRRFEVRVPEGLGIGDVFEISI